MSSEMLVKDSSKPTVVVGRRDMEVAERSDWSGSLEG